MKPFFVRATMSVLAAVIAALGLSTVTASASAAATAPVAQRTGTASPSMGAEDYEQRVRMWINKQRTKRHLPRLTFEDCTDGVAERWGSYLARTQSFFHQSMGKLLTTCRARYAGETLAKGQVTPRAIVQLWMDSPGHRAILLSQAPRRIGIGASVDATGTWVVAANFTRF